MRAINISEQTWLALARLQPLHTHTDTCTHICTHTHEHLFPSPLPQRMTRKRTGEKQINYEQSSSTQSDTDPLPVFPPTCLSAHLPLFSKLCPQAFQLQHYSVSHTRLHVWESKFPRRYLWLIQQQWFKEEDRKEAPKKLKSHSESVQIVHTHDYIWHMHLQYIKHIHFQRDY